MLQEVGSGADRLRDGLHVHASTRPRAGEVGLVKLGGEVGLVRREESMDVEHIPSLWRMDPTDPHVPATFGEAARPLPERSEHRPIAHVSRVRERDEVAPRRDVRHVSVRLLAYPHHALLGRRQGWTPIPRWGRITGKERMHDRGASGDRVLWPAKNLRETSVYTCRHTLRYLNDPARTNRN